MNNLSRPRPTIVLTTALLGLLALPGCEEPTRIGPAPETAPETVPDTDVENDKPAEYTPSDMVITPVDRTVVDNRGRSLDVRILARSGTHARVVRQTDGVKFDLLIADLREEDQRYINRIPETPIIGALETGAKTAGENKSKTPPYIENRQESIARLEIKLEELRAEFETMSSAANSRKTPRIRQKEKELNQTNAEIARLQGQIDVYLLQNEG